MERSGSLYQRNAELLRLALQDESAESAGKKRRETTVEGKKHMGKRCSEGSTKSQPMFKPTISKRSLRIAAQLGDPRERILSAKRDISADAADRPCSPSFRPTLNQKSIRLTTRLRGPTHAHNQSERLDALSSVNQSMCDRSYRLLQGEQEEENKQCTFQPRVKGSSAVRGDVVQRLSHWAKVKAENHKQAVESIAGKDLEECTFMPSILEVRGSPRTKVPLSNGVEKFLQRQRLARSKKQQVSVSPVRTKSPIVDPPTLSNTKQFPPKEELTAVDFATARLLLHCELHAS